MKKRLTHGTQLFEDSEKQAIYGKLKYYEDLEEQGKLLKLSCTPGQDVYVLVGMNDNGKYTKVKHDVVKCIYIDEKNADIPMLQFTYVWHDTELSDVGQTVFLTKFEAEKALQKMNEMDG